MSFEQLGWPTKNEENGQTEEFEEYTYLKILHDVVDRIQMLHLLPRPVLLQDYL